MQPIFQITIPSDDKELYPALRNKFGNTGDIVDVIPGTVVLISPLSPTNSSTAMAAEIHSLVPSSSPFITHIHPADIGGGLPDAATKWLLGKWGV
jgi:hypothetical protein